VAFKVNYGLKKAERDRAKKAKKEAKARDRDATASPAPEHPGDALPEDVVAPGVDPTTDA
jgi:hypothetical protein